LSEKGCALAPDIRPDASGVRFEEERFYATHKCPSFKPGGLVVVFERLRDYAEEIGLTMFVFGLLTWLYVIQFQFLYPAMVTGGTPFAHLAFPPFNWRLDDVGMLSFVVSAIGFLIWRIQIKRLRASRPRSKR
jgi:hypothetical protein